MRRYLGLTLVLVLAGLCSACGVLYTMNGNATHTTPADPAIQAVAEQLMRGTQVNVTVAPEIQLQQTYVAYDEQKHQKFTITPAIPVELTVHYLNGLSGCDAPSARCRTVNVQITKLAWFPGVAPNEGFPLPVVGIRIVANVSSNGESDVKTCLVRGTGPSKWGILVSSHNLTPNFRVAVRNAFAEAFICVLTPDSRYYFNFGPYFFTHLQVF